MSGEGIKVPKRDPPKAREVGTPEGSPSEGAKEAAAEPKPESLGSPAPPAGGKEFFLIEYYHEILRGVRWLRATPKPDEGVIKRTRKGFVRWSRGRKSRYGAIAVVGIIVVSYMLFAAQTANTPTGNFVPPGGGGPGENQGTWTASGTVAENGKDTASVMPANATMPRSFASLRVVLTWTDEPASNPLRRNLPDNLGLNVTAPNGQSWQEGPVANGRVEWTLDATGQDLGGTTWEDWTVVVLGGSMGDEQPISGPRPCPLCASDNSNTYSLSADYSW